MENLRESRTFGKESEKVAVAGTVSVNQMFGPNYSEAQKISTDTN